MQYSYSRVDCFKRCKLKYKMRYLDKIETIPETNADNALLLGTALHEGVEKSADEGIKEYLMSFPVITDEQINETVKLNRVIPMLKNAIPEGGEFEVPIDDKDYIGFIDYLVSVGDKTYDIYDFKYSNNVDSYVKSPQLHLYKYFYERGHPGERIRNLYFAFVPKIRIKQNKTETVMEYRRRIENELKEKDINIVQIKFDYEKVIEFLFDIKAVNEETEFAPNVTNLCRYCEYQEFCEKGWDYFMTLPENKRRNIETVQKRTLWIYGAPFCGKTTFANGFPDPLMINTDGNIKFVDAPYISIKDEVKVEGRQTKRTLAWEVFKDTISELEKKENGFKTIVVDLLEDMYEHCRLYMYQQMGISHESDDSFRAWDRVRGEFLNTLRRLMNLDYENIILISHEDMSKDITRRSGDKITAIRPSLPDKVANKVAGMVDVVARIVADGNARELTFKSDEVVFGGGRLKTDEKEIPLDVNAFFEVYDRANKAAGESVKKTARKTTKKTASAPASETPVSESPKLCEEDTYFYIELEDNYVKKHAGDAYPKGGKVVTQEEFDEGLKRLSNGEKQETQEEIPATPRRRRRVRTDEE